MQYILAHLLGVLGSRKLRALKENSNYFREEMHRLGLHVYGDADSPIVPVMFYMPFKVCAFSRMCLERGLAVVAVGYPATQVHLNRARFCISAAHTRADLEYTVKVMEELAETLNIRYDKYILG
jgi:serine palmitoyltransferase